MLSRRGSSVGFSHSIPEGYFAGAFRWIFSVVFLRAPFVGPAAGCPLALCGPSPHRPAVSGVVKPVDLGVAVELAKDFDGVVMAECVSVRQQTVDVGVFVVDVGSEDARVVRSHYDRRDAVSLLFPA